MADTRHTTELEFKVNAREVNALGRKLKEVFGTQHARQYNTAQREITKSLHENAQATEKIASAMQKVERGSKAWKQLNKDLRAATQESRNLERAMSGLQRVQQRISGGGGMGRAGGALGGRGAVGQGMAAGMGIGTAGAMGTALGAIPVAGALAAGSMYAAFQAYGSYVSQQQAVAGATPFLLSAGERYRRTQVAAAQAGVAPQLQVTATGGGSGMGMRAATAGQTVFGAQEIGRQRIEKMAVDQVTTAILGETLGGLYNRTRGTAYDTQHYKALVSLAGLPDRIVGAGGGGKAVRAAEMAGSQLALMEQGVTTEVVAGRAGRGARFSRPFDPGAIQTAGGRFGYKPQEAIQMAGQLAGAAAKSFGGGLTNDDIELGMALQRRFGIGMAQTGGTMRAITRAGGAGEGVEVAALIGTHVAKGLEASEINTALQQQTSFLEDQARFGVKVDVGRMVKMESQLFQAGISGFMAGPMAQQIGGGIAGQFRGAGANTPMKLMMMKQLGFTGAGGAEEFAKFELMMQDPNNALMAAMGLAGEIGQAQGLGGSQKTRFLQRTLGGMGITLGESQVESLMGAAGQKGFDIKSAEGQKAAINFMKTFVGEAAAITPGVLRGEAGIEATRIGVGAGVAESVQNMQMAALNTAKSFNNLAGPIIARLTGSMEGLSAAIEAVTFQYANPPPGIQR